MAEAIPKVNPLVHTPNEAVGGNRPGYDVIMARFFNTAGPCHPQKHYMLPAERRVVGLRRLIDQELYFVVHAPRQVGKTTSLRTLAESLTAEGRYAALLTSCEVGQKLQLDLKGSIEGIVAELHVRARLSLPEELRPPPADPSQPPAIRLRDLLTRWAEQSPRPVLVFFDEIDALYDDALISVLRQLRTGYDGRPRAFPQSVALIGMRDVRDYKIEARGCEQTMGTASPFNVKSDSLLLRNFTAEEVAELYDQHTAETGQAFTGEAKALAFELTRGQPWLVNALARQLVEVLVPERDAPIDAQHVEAAKELLIQRRDTHLDSLIDRLREERVRKVVGAVLSGELLPEDALNDDVEFVEDLGLVSPGPQGLEISNPLYREIIPRALTLLMESSLFLPRPSYIDERGGLDFPQLLSDFREFWVENAEAFLHRAPYAEAAAQLVFMAFLHKITNGKGGFVDREYAAGRGSVDLCVRWPLPTGEVLRWAVELKVWRDTTSGDPVKKGCRQLAEYLARLGLDQGTLVVFDSRSGAAPLPERCSEEEVVEGGRRITVMML